MRFQHCLETVWAIDTQRSNSPSLHQKTKVSSDQRKRAPKRTERRCWMGPDTHNSARALSPMLCRAWKILLVKWIAAKVGQKKGPCFNGDCVGGASASGGWQQKNGRLGIEGKSRLLCLFSCAFWKKVFEKEMFDHSGLWVCHIRIGGLRFDCFLLISVPWHPNPRGGIRFLQFFFVERKIFFCSKEKKNNKKSKWMSLIFAHLRQCFFSEEWSFYLILFCSLAIAFDWGFFSFIWKWTHATGFVVVATAASEASLGVHAWLVVSSGVREGLGAIIMHSCVIYAYGKK